METTTKRAQAIGFTTLAAAAIVVLWLLPVQLSMEYDHSADGPRTDGMGRYGLLGNFEVEYTMYSVPSPQPSLGDSLRQAAIALFPFAQADDWTWRPRPASLVPSLLATILVIALLRTLTKRGILRFQS